MSRTPYTGTTLRAEYLVDSSRSSRAAFKTGVFMDIVAYWQQHIAPFVRAKLGRSERGASLVEYALLVALIAVVCIVAITVLGHKVSTKFSSTASSLL